MYLTILHKHTYQEIDKCQAQEWSEAIQFVEDNKEKYFTSLPPDVEEIPVKIYNNRAGTYCYWVITKKKRSI